jgi:hypothetical protein
MPAVFGIVAPDLVALAVAITSPTPALILGRTVFQFECGGKEKGSSRRPLKVGRKAPVTAHHQLTLRNESHKRINMR